MEVKLIEAVRERDVLYDTNHPDYMKTKYKLQLWNEIATEIGMKTGAEAKTTWEKLRHSLRDAIRRQTRCVRNGTATPTNQRPWRFQNQMAFLQQYSMSRKQENNFTDGSDEDMPMQDCEQFKFKIEPESVYEDTVKIENKENEDENGFMDPVCVLKEKVKQQQRQETATNLPSCSKPCASLLKQYVENREKRAVERAAERDMLIEKIQQTSDPLYHFFMSMYETTKKMPPQLQHIVKNKVYKTVTDMEGYLLNIPQTSEIDLTEQSSVQISSASIPVLSYSDNSLLLHPNTVSNISAEMPIQKD